MGNQLQHFTTKHSFDLNNWQEIAPFTHITQRREKNFVTFKNKNSKLMIDRYHVQFPSQEQRIKYIIEIQKRYKLSCSIDILGYQIPAYQQLCGNTYRLYLFTQHIPFRLEAIKKLSISQYLFVLSSALAGFAELFSQKGFFFINQSLLCFNKVGKVKVWVNSNLSKNDVEDCGRNCSDKSEKSMVMRLFQIISRKVEDQNNVLNFFQFAKNMNFSVHNFQQAGKALKFYQKELKVQPVSNILSNSPQKPNQKPLSINPTQRINPKSSPMVQKQSKIKVKKPLSCIKFHKPNKIGTLMPNFELKNFDESKSINVIWKEGMNKQYAPQRKQKTHLFVQERQGTLADDLVSDISFLSVQKPFTPAPLRQHYFETEESFEKNQIYYSSDLNRQSELGRINYGFEKKRKQKTCASTPRDHLEMVKCKYSTLDRSIQIDPSIAQDLLKYL